MLETAAVSSTHILNFDSHSMLNVINQGRMEHTLLEHRASFHAHIHRWSNSEFVADYGLYNFPVVVRGEFAPRMLCIGFADQPNEEIWINGWKVRRHDIQIYSEDCELFYKALSNTSWCAITVERERLQQFALESVGRELVLPAHGIANRPTDTCILAELRRLILRAVSLRPGDACEFLQRRCLNLLTRALIIAENVVENYASSRASYRDEIIRNSHRFLSRRVGDRFSSRQLCRHLGIEERSLQLYFQEAIGKSPREWHQILALSAARDQLLSFPARSSTITQVAIACGFHEVGRFSGRYKKHFGELPSETIARRSKASLEH